MAIKRKRGAPPVPRLALLASLERAGMLKGAELVFFALAKSVDANLRCRMSLPVLASKAGVAMRTCCRAVESLEEAGLIRRDPPGGGRGRTCVYVIPATVWRGVPPGAGKVAPRG